MACSLRLCAAAALSSTSAAFCCVIWSSCVTATFTWPDSGLEIPTYYLEPLIVTAENGEEVYADNEELLAAFKAGQ